MMHCCVVHWVPMSAEINSLFQNCGREAVFTRYGIIYSAKYMLARTFKELESYFPLE